MKKLHVMILIADIMIMYLYRSSYLVLALLTLIAFYDLTVIFSKE